MSLVTQIYLEGLNQQVVPEESTVPHQLSPWLLGFFTQRDTTGFGRKGEAAIECLFYCVLQKLICLPTSCFTKMYNR